MPERKTQQQKDATRRHEHEAEGGVAGTLAGAAMGAIAGPPEAAAGAVIGEERALLGGVVGRRGTVRLGAGRRTDAAS